MMIYDALKSCLRISGTTPSILKFHLQFTLLLHTFDGPFIKLNEYKTSIS